MLNLAIKKLCPILKFKLFYSSTIGEKCQTQFEKPNNIKVVILNNLHKNQRYNATPQIQKRKIKNEWNEKQKNYNKKVFYDRFKFKEAIVCNIQTSVANFATQKHGKGEVQMKKNAIIEGFNKNLDMVTKLKNCEKIMNAINVLSQKKTREQFQTLVKNFLNQQKLPEHKLLLEQKKLFNKVQQLFLKNFHNVEITREFLLTFSKCDPNFIDFDSLKKIQQIEESYTYFQNSNLKKESLVALGRKQKPKILEGEKLTEIVKSEGLSLLKNDKIIQNPLLRKIKIKSHVKNQPLIKQFIDTEQNLKIVQNKLFGDRKILTEHVIFQRLQNKSNQMFNNFGENWVYAYDLPYKFLQEDAQKLITALSVKYGQIDSFTQESYHKIKQTPYSQILYVLPENLEVSSHKNQRIQKIQKIQIENEKSQNEKKGKIRKEKDLVKLILEKTKKQRQGKLNRSSLIFKFKKKSDKEKFLTSQMRLYGMNILNFKNIKFEQAQFKNIVTLSMIPWDCESADLLKFINKNLYSMKIVLTHPNCIIGSGYVFLKLANFYQAFFTQQLLHDLNYQNQVLKAQLYYGPLFKYNGVYKHTFEFNHYQQLVEKMSNYREKILDKI